MSPVFDSSQSYLRRLEELIPEAEDARARIVGVLGLHGSDDVVGGGGGGGGGLHEVEIAEGAIEDPARGG